MPSAIAGPGPSTLATREGQGSAGPLDVVKGRLQAHLQGSAASSARQSAPGLSSPNSMVLDDLWELEDLVGESGDDEYDGPPNDTIRQERRQKRMRDDMVEITDELTESTIITQMFERVHEDGRRWSSPWHTRQRSAPLPEVTVEDTEDEEPEVQARTTVNSPRRQSMASLSSLEDENDWIEVDQLLEGDRDAKEPPSAPNGSTSVGTQSYLDALENPSANAERIQLVLQTMTNKLLQRKRTVRRAMAEDHSDTSSREGIIRRDGSIQELTPIRPDVRSIEWRGDQQDQSGMTSSAASISSNTPSASTWASTSNYRPIAMSRFFPRQTKSPPSSYDRHAASKNSSMGRAMSRVRSAFRTKSNRTSRDTRPEASDNTRDPSTSSSISTAGLAQSPTNSPVSEIPSNVKGGVKGPPPTPYVPSQSRKSATCVARAGPDARRQPNNYPPRPSVTAVHETVRTSRNRIQAASSQPIFESPASLFPHDSLIKNVHRFMRYSSAAYGVSQCTSSL